MNEDDNGRADNDDGNDNNIEEEKEEEKEEDELADGDLSCGYVKKVSRQPSEFGLTGNPKQRPKEKRNAKAHQHTPTHTQTLCVARQSQKECSGQSEEQASAIIQVFRDKAPTSSATYSFANPQVNSHHNRPPLLGSSAPRLLGSSAGNREISHALSTVVDHTSISPSWSWSKITLEEELLAVLLAITTQPSLYLSPIKDCIMDDHKLVPLWLALCTLAPTTSSMDAMKSARGGHSDLIFPSSPYEAAHIFVARICNDRSPLFLALACEQRCKHGQILLSSHRPLTAIGNRQSSFGNQHKSRSNRRPVTFYASTVSEKQFRTSRFTTPRRIRVNAAASDVHNLVGYYLAGTLLPLSIVDPGNMMQIRVT
ncbi:hypothetical protein NDA14_005324 [Ustilago hordei]|nr:hypothetical protein NDA14_005324 [Ustilago hordei]